MATAAKAAAPAKKGTGTELRAYCMSTKQKEVIDNPEISKTARGQYIAKGTATKAKHKVSVIMSETAALAAIKDGVAKKDF